MDIYSIAVQDLPPSLKGKVTVVPDLHALYRAVAVEFAELLEQKQKSGEMLTVITPVGPLDYYYFAVEVQRRGLSCKHLRTINMDEYLDEQDRLIRTDHPLSFRRFMEQSFFSRLEPEQRPDPENIVFPDPAKPEAVTELIDKIGGADICWGGFGITGHLAFNDPPGMLGEPEELDSFRNCKTRKLTISPMSTAQMAMGGTNGNLEILPRRAVTLGMYELLKSKRIHLIFMRRWHSGLWRRALLGPVSSSFPGSLVQDHPDYRVIMTELAAAPPLLNVAQAIGEES
ncbi:Glucosamine-6-phosphate deaminase 1 [subsurface metagenome]